METPNKKEMEGSEAAHKVRPLVSGKNNKKELESQERFWINFHTEKRGEVEWEKDLGSWRQAASDKSRSECDCSIDLQHWSYHVNSLYEDNAAGSLDSP